MSEDILGKLDLKPMSKNEKKIWDGINDAIRRKAQEYEKQKRINAAQARITSENLIVG